MARRVVWFFIVILLSRIVQFISVISQWKELYGDSLNHVVKIWFPNPNAMWCMTKLSWNMNRHYRNTTLKDGVWPSFVCVAIRYLNNKLYSPIHSELNVVRYVNENKPIGNQNDADKFIINLNRFKLYCYVNFIVFFSVLQCGSIIDFICWGLVCTLKSWLVLSPTVWLIALFRSRLRKQAF